MFYVFVPSVLFVVNPVFVPFTDPMKHTKLPSELLHKPILQRLRNVFPLHAV